MATDDELAALTDDQRLTLLYQVFTSVLVPNEDGTYQSRTLGEAVEDSTGFPVMRLLDRALPLAAPPYTHEEFRQMMGALRVRC